MRRFAVIGVAVSIGVLVFAPRGSQPVLASPRSRSGSAPTGSILVRSTACADRRRRGRSSRSSGHEESAPPGLVGRANQARARSARAAPARSARARGRSDRLGRRGARVPAAALRARRACRGREFHPEHGRRAPPLPAQARPFARRDRRTEHLPLARGRRAAPAPRPLACRRSRARASSPSPRATT